ncbi:aminotransferase class I/II-fold pyridoxal phosphate-dependent enzyme [Candidatus Peregrinibacteria bacterium]|nr:aminotransferase class I/II-fold pyridoxal phosphate-dependent enzyme [Candidatus Peregrinibacteria bacterium]
MGESVAKVEDWLKKYFQTKYAFTIFVDIDDNFCIDYIDLERKITQKTKILIIQHTFGRPANLEKILEIARERNLKVIEDCAHSFGAKHNGQLTGTFGDIGMFSFGSDKNISCVRGGALITNNDELAKKIADFRSRLPLSRRVKVIQHLWHYPTFSKGKLLYNLWIGKFILAVAKKINLINKIIYQPEKEGRQVLFYPSLLPNALAEILLNQLSRLEKTTKHRQMLAKMYDKEINGDDEIVKPKWSDESVWLRYTLLVKNPQALHASAKRQGIILGNWYDCPVAPKDVDLSATDYELGSCPNDEKLSQMSINLPTDPCITEKDARRIVQLINLWK